MPPSIRSEGMYVVYKPEEYIRNYVATTAHLSNCTMLHIYCDGEMLQTIMALGVDNFIKIYQTVTDKNLNFLLQMCPSATDRL